jgi:membrane protein YqaA with SNARE-associated domain
VTGTLVGAVLYGFASAFLPALPVEPYLAGMVAALGTAAVPLGVAAALGQTAGKLVIFLGTRGVLRSERLRAWSSRHATKPKRFVWLRSASRRLTAVLDRPALATPVVFLSAALGLPPLLLVSVYAARTPMSAITFTVVCLLGRAIRFVLVAMAPRLVIG